MRTTQIPKNLPADHPYNIVNDLLRQHPMAPQMEPAVARSVAVLERRAPQIVRDAREVGVDVVPLGINPLFQAPRFYEGSQTDWILGPVTLGDDAIVPWREGQDLRRLSSIGVHPLTYIAHETDPSKTKELRAEAATGHREITPAHAAELVGPVPPPVESVALGEQLARRATQVATGVRRSVKIAGAAAVGVAAAPVVIAGGLLASLATLDPVVLGALPAISEKPGAPAYWLILTRWDW